jgi:hypothetical protein
MSEAKWVSKQGEHNTFNEKRVKNNKVQKARKSIVA